MGDFSGEILSEVSAPLAEKPVYTTPITLPNGNRYKVENKIKVISQFCITNTTVILYVYIAQAESNIKRDLK